MLRRIRQTLARRVKEVVVKEEGASLVEYALLVALVAVVCIAAVTLLGTNISQKLNDIANSIGT
jgi:pilus assembly protein Flp/PilA